MFYKKCTIDNLYVVSGLARSGNHLFISWLISGLAFTDIIYLNNMKLYEFSECNELFDEIEINKSIIKYRLISKEQKSHKLDSRLIDKLATRSFVRKILDGDVIHVKCMIISFENKKSNIFKFIESQFIKTNKIYRVQVIRDILNLTASIMETHERDRGEDYDRVDVSNIWFENYYQKETDIIFNYNKFLYDLNYRHELCAQLKINYDIAYISKNMFGRTKGSSFQQQVNDIYDYYMRFGKYVQNSTILKYLHDRNIKEILCNDFGLCISGHTVRIANTVEKYIKYKLKNDS